MVSCAITQMHLYSNIVNYLSEEQDGLVQFVLQQAGFNEGQGPSIDLNEAMTTLAISDCRGGFLNWLR